MGYIWGIWSENPYTTWHAYIDGGKVHVIAEFRAKNSFGALILSRWGCEVTKDGSDWLLLRLQEGTSIFDLFCVFLCCGLRGG